MSPAEAIVTDISTPPALPGKPPRSAASNALAAMLGAKFLCSHCHSWHAPGSRLIDVCRRRFASQCLSDMDMQLYWRAEFRPYDTRQKRREYTGTWSRADQQTYKKLFTQLQALAVSEDFGPASLAELTLEHGPKILTTRYQAWQAETTQHIDAAKAKAIPILAKIEHLLPPPYPAGPPTYLRHSGTSTWVPAPATGAELSRVATLATPPMRRTIDHTTRRAFLRWSPAQTDTTNIYDLVARMFSTEIDNWEQRCFRRKRLSTVINLLGLDPAFWGNVQITKRRLTLTTNTFNAAPNPDSSVTPQLVLPLSPEFQATPRQMTRKMARSTLRVP